MRGCWRNTPRAARKRDLSSTGVVPFGGQAQRVLSYGAPSTWRRSKELLDNLTSGAAASSGSQQTGPTFHGGGTSSYRRGGVSNGRRIHAPPRLTGRIPLLVRPYLKGDHCGEKSAVRLDGLRLFRRHAARLRLEERWCASSGGRGSRLRSGMLRKNLRS